MSDFNYTRQNLGNPNRSRSQEINYEHKTKA